VGISLQSAVWRSAARSFALHSRREWFDVDQKVGFGRQPTPPIVGQTTARHQVMHVRVVAQIARPGLQDAEQAHLRAQKASVVGQLHQRGGRGAKEQIVERALVAIGDITQLGRQREGDQEVGHTGSSNSCWSESQFWAASC
jgi:hypothetical protein